eukprot:CAMPEP_0168316406 /NCGR_PEP_ID=MMETSP0210-20121227/15361_1 /TAXON_ID=40633 /ORGANISM="Condylostoma magnum, Strain COL2" /LENGTH=65 /DNA_ID=CAMNT_0008296835 /DNA_START=471 /DNA_END=668 /DNA_ORIENTATION=-
MYRFNLTGEYNAEGIRGSLKVFDDLALSLSAVAGTRRFGAGVDLSYKDSKLTGYNATAYWHEDEH